MENLLEMKTSLPKDEEGIINNDPPLMMYTEGVTLTEEEQNRLKEMESNPNQVMLVDKDSTGRSNTTTVDNYLSSLDNKILDNKLPESDLKLINKGDIKESSLQLTNELRQNLILSTKANLLHPDSVSDDEILQISANVLERLQKYFHEDKLSASVVEKKLTKKLPAEVFEILPVEYMDLYTTEEDRKNKPNTSKKILLENLSYMILSGPEIDYLNDYIDNENKLVLVSKRLLQCRIDLSQALQDEKTISELIQESRVYEPEDTSFWSQYIKIPNRVSNDFAQRIVIYQKYKESYEKILKEYEDTQENQEVRQAILDEIEECNLKIQIYQNVCELELFPPIWENLVNLHHNMKKLNMRYIIKEAIDAVDRVRRCKQDLPFPAYDTSTKNPEKILKSHIPSYAKMVLAYNANLRKADSLPNENNLPKPDIEPVSIPGYKDSDVATVFSILLTILMGRVLKKLTKGTHDKYDAIVLDSYFQMFSKLGTDIYLMNKVWIMMKDHVQEILVTYFLPSTE